ncbi:MAG: hypothetical protein GY855_08025, partial [candidate division Zixibacteria bacterium]|nr:hypothetical protein [candidate division Zixibacteria bacterium]
SNGNGIAVGMGGVTYSTSDFGKSWKHQVISEESLYNVILTDRECIAVGDAAVVYWTGNAGERWEKIEPPELMRQYWFLPAAHLGENKYITGGSRGSMLFIQGLNVLHSSVE